MTESPLGTPITFGKDLIQRVQEYDPESLLVEALRPNVGTWTGYEHLLVCVAIHGSQSQTRPCPTETALELLEKAEHDVVGQSGQLGGMQWMLLNSRALRPRWLSCPVYQELLAPFNALCKQQTGLTVEEIFQELGTFDAQKLDQVSQPLVNALARIARPWESIRTHEDAYGTAVLRIKGELALMGPKTPDLMYRYLCGLFQSLDPHYSDKKGKSLEAFVSRRLRESAPTWEWLQGYYLDNREKDLLGLASGVGFAVETKSLKIRPATATNYGADVTENLGALGKAKEQLDPVVGALLNGGTIRTSELIPRSLAPASLVLPCIVTDEISTPYVRSMLDEYLEGAWTGPHSPLLLCAVDFSFVLEWAGSLAVLFDYMEFRRHPAIRWTDEPECLLAYGMEPMMNMLGVAPNIDLRGFDWERIRKEGWKAIRPQWLARLEAVRDQESRGRFPVALRYLDQDKRKMRTWANDRRRNPGPEVDTAVEDLLEGLPPSSSTAGL